MAIRKLIWVLFGIAVISVWVLGSAIQAGTETLNYKSYTYAIKGESMPVGDVEGHSLLSFVRGGFYVFENGEVATANQVGTGEEVKGGFSILYYCTLTFPDGSTIMTRVQGALGGGCQESLQRADINTKSSRGQADSKESRGLHPPKASLFLPRKGNLDQSRLRRELISTPSLPSGFFEVRIKERKRRAQVEWPGLFGYWSYGCLFYCCFLFPIIKVEISLG
jgi:hypothetical protein